MPQRLHNNDTCNFTKLEFLAKLTHNIWRFHTGDFYGAIIVKFMSIIREHDVFRLNINAEAQIAQISIKVEKIAV